MYSAKKKKKKTLHCAFLQCNKIKKKLCFILVSRIRGAYKVVAYTDAELLEKVGLLFNSFMRGDTLLCELKQN